MHDAKDFKLFHATQITRKTSIVLWLWITFWDDARWCHENWLVSNWGDVKVRESVPKLGNKYRF